MKTAQEYKELITAVLEFKAKSIIDEAVNSPTIDENIVSYYVQGIEEAIDTIKKSEFLLK